MLERPSRLRYAPVKPVMHRRCELFESLEAVNRALHLDDVSGRANSVMT
ncbi:MULTISPECIES: hypothetical protein [Burkholderiaceae]|nr:MULTISPECIES: hypothetical protein [Burkholderiaceae]MCG1019774.1 hypothetical protein [Mycetohabitans sp. B4]MCG1040614.1 hypothetical protein [Mycetohabitans sp. B7]SIT65378.1 hypothetical protein SAMN04487769_0721 [Burkholderia sp. b14]SIT79898.1 hypothetical protein SAMN04487768_0346 [Burkholderia sp. b13]